MTGQLIREAERTDVSALCALNDAVQALHVAHRPEVFRPTRAEELAARFIALLSDPNVKIWVSVQDGVLNGYLVGTVRTQASGPYVLARSWLELDQIGVAAESRRKGVGRALVAQALAFARTRAVDGVELSSWSFNEDAQRAFQKLGFSPKTVRFEYRK